jgi:hypothetical protein
MTDLDQLLDLLHDLRIGHEQTKELNGSTSVRIDSHSHRVEGHSQLYMEFEFKDETFSRLILKADC